MKLLPFPLCQHDIPPNNCAPCLRDELMEVDAQIAALRLDGVATIGLYAPTEWHGPDLETKWLVPDFIGDGMRTLLVSPAGAGKTWLSLSIGLSVAHNIPFLGRKVNNQGLRPVILLDEENHPDTIRKRVRSLARGAGIDPSSELLRHYGQRGYHRNPDAWGDFMQEVSDLDPCLIILDTARRFLKGDENDSGPVAEFWNWLDGVRNVSPRPTAVLVLHHSGHSEARARGSSDWLASPDLILQISGSVDTALEVHWQKVRSEKPRRKATISFIWDGNTLSLKEIGI